MTREFFPHGLSKVIKRKIAFRDGYRLDKGIHYAVCSVCGKESRITKLTIGHRIAVARGGTDDLENLELQCEPCNRMDGRKYGRPNGPRPVVGTISFPEAVRRVRERYGPQLQERGRRFDNVVVRSSDGAQVSWTSCRRALIMIERGFARQVEEDQDGLPAVIDLTYRLDVEPTNHRIENDCHGCGAGEGLRRFNIVPAWHPLWRNEPGAAYACMICGACRGRVEGAYEAAIAAVSRGLPPRRKPSASAREDHGVLLRYYWWKEKGIQVDSDTLRRVREIMGTDDPDPVAASQKAHELADSVLWEDWLHEKKRREAAVAAGLDFQWLFRQAVLDRATDGRYTDV